MSEWKTIESAPMHKEVLVWRKDRGVFIAQYTTPENVLPDNELEQWDFQEDFTEWFSDAYGWQEGSEKPTHWMAIPDGPLL